MACSQEKRTRMTNFTENQLRTLVSMYGQNSAILNSKLTSAVTNGKKAAVWAQVTDAVNASGSGFRTVAGVKKKWLEMKSVAVSCGSARRKPKTGGGPPPDEPWFVQYILDIL